MGSNKKLIIESGIYQHYKGKKYQVIGETKHSETLEEMVLYKALYGDYQLWVRLKKIFLEKINIDGNLISRFRLIRSNENSKPRRN